MGKIQVEQPYDFVSDEPMENYSGIITYANYNYIYQLRKYRSTHQSHSLMIHQWHQKYKKPQAMCFIHKPIQKLRN